MRFRPFWIFWYAYQNVKKAIFFLCPQKNRLFCLTRGGSQKVMTDMSATISCLFTPSITVANHFQRGYQTVLKRLLLSSGYHHLPAFAISCQCLPALARHYRVITISYYQHLPLVTSFEKVILYYIFNLSACFKAEGYSWQCPGIRSLYGGRPQPPTPRPPPASKMPLFSPN